MILSSASRALLAGAFLSFVPPLFAAVQLVPVVASGLTSPVFVGHAGDGSNRLFIVELGGTLRVLQPGASSATVFLDVRAKVLAGGERGLLGLAFHPQYGGNGRFFVFYTRAGDGALVIAEYRVSSGNRDVADTTERVLLTIPHSANSNHNGGMLAFGPDGYLYIGVGDGGSSNDPPNNAQNVNVLLGKILRIDVDRPDASAGTLYSSPAGNPFVGPIAGADEIFAYGWRNPWRFSFDRVNGAQWVADVGQGAREEVDTPIVAGGNYGWRVYEGSICSGNDPGLCNPANYLPPKFDYDHAGGRCSITGGYVYRGGQNALPTGTYVFGDFCTGEIFEYGWRNPWRFSFDRDTGAQFVFVMMRRAPRSTLTPIVAGGNYGWRVYEGSICSGNDPGLCNPANYLPPKFDYDHAGGRCSITGGYVYRGGQNALPTGTYVFGDFCTGEIFAWNGAAQSLLLDTTLNVSSFGEDEQGEIYVVGLGGTVSRIASATPCTYSPSATQASFGGPGGNGSVSVSAGAGCAWTARSNASWITLTGSGAGNGNGTVAYAVAPYGGPSKTRTGTLTVAGQTFTVRQSKKK
jgi:glucose/arabinose dehydrogenase